MRLKRTQFGIIAAVLTAAVFVAPPAMGEMVWTYYFGITSDNLSKDPATMWYQNDGVTALPVGCMVEVWWDVGGDGPDHIDPATCLPSGGNDIRVLETGSVPLGGSIGDDVPF